MNNIQRNLENVCPVTLSTKHFCQKTEDTVLKITVFMRFVTGQSIYYTNSKSFYEKNTFFLPILLELTSFRRERIYKIFCI